MNNFNVVPSQGKFGESISVINQNFQIAQQEMQILENFASPRRKYATVVATSQTESKTDVLPATGSTDTTYRVGNWDGAQFDETSYTEYAWDGTQYVPLSTNSQIGEVFDISEYKAVGGTLATFADLSAALNDGNNVPVGIRKGGMSVKFVQSSDNKYVEYRYMGTATTGTPNPFLDTANWQGVDNAPIAGSENLVKSGGIANAIGGPIKMSELHKCIVTNGEIGSVVNTTPQTSTFPIRCAIISIDEGDTFIINGTSGSSNGRWWAFTDSSYHLISHADVNASGNNLRLTAPANAVYFIINDVTDSISYYIGKEFNSIDSRILDLEKELGISIPQSEPYKYIFTRVEVGNRVNVTPQTSPVAYKYSIIPVKEGDSFVINGTGGDDPRLWCFVDYTYCVISKSDASITAKKLELVAPPNSAYLILNSKSNETSYYKGLASVVSYNKETLDKIYEELVFNDNVAYNVHGTIGDTLSLDEVSASSYKAIKIPCQEGDTFIVNAVAGGDTAKALVFVDSNNTMIPPVATTVFHGAITAPANSSYVIIQTNNKNLMSYAGKDNMLIDTRARVLMLEAQSATYNIIRSLGNDGVFGSFNLILPQNKTSLPLRVSIRAKYTGSAPKISFSSGLYNSNSYTLGGEGEFSIKEWRIPPDLHYDLVRIYVNVPQDCTLVISDFYVGKDNAVPKKENGVRLNAHLGFQSVAPENTMAAFELAAQCGFPACVVNPIANADGTVYCYHEDDATLLYNDTSVALSAAQFAALTDENMDDYRVIGYGEQRKFYNEKIPTLSEFLYLCSLTGMRPILGTHPAPTNAQWSTIRNLLVKYKLLEKATIKAFSISILESAFSVLGPTVQGFVYDVSGIDADSYCTALDNSVLSQFKGEKGVEYKRSLVTQEAVETTLNRGYLASVWEVGRITGDEYKKLIKWGISEFTEDYNCCSGLNF